MKIKKSVLKILSANSECFRVSAGIAPNVEALAKKGHLKNECSALAPKFHSSTNVQFTTSSPFFANAMLVAAVFTIMP
jgi:hypothetical protein